LGTAWFVHLPSGEKIRFRFIGREGSLVRFTTGDGPHVIVAPNAVVVTIESAEADPEGFPVEFSDEGQEAPDA